MLSITLTTLFLTLLSASYTIAAPTDTLQQRYELTCQDNGGGYRPVQEAQACVDFLLDKGNADCTVADDNSTFCRVGSTVITGSNVNNKPEGARSSCRDVALGAQKIIDSCTTPEGKVGGTNAANGNADIIVAINRG
ncbi:hypothetical protein BDV12DRAFT_172255 [Aspergillus spectabilis]